GAAGVRRLLRGEVRRGGLHPGARRRARRPGRGHAADARRDADRLLRRPGGEVPAPTGREAERPGGRGRGGAVRAPPASRLCGPRAGGLPGRGVVLPVILVLRALGVGDLATAAPALRGLRRAFPRDELCLAAPAWLAPLVELVGGIDRLVPVAGLGPVRWPVHGPQV